MALSSSRTLKQKRKKPSAGWLLRREMLDPEKSLTSARLTGRGQIPTRLPGASYLDKTHHKTPVITHCRWSTYKTLASGTPSLRKQIEKC